MRCIGETMISLETIRRAHSTEGGMARHYLTLYACVIGVEAKSVFEFGGGHSTTTILEALEETDGTLITCDPQKAEALWLKPNDRWTHLKMESRKALKTLEDNQMFDLVFHDGTHKEREVRHDIKLIFPHLKKNGLLLIHDTFDNEKSYGILNVLSDIIKEHSTLCYGHGLTIVRQTEGDISIQPKWTKDR